MNSTNGNGAETVLTLRMVSKTFQTRSSASVMALRNTDLEIGKGDFAVITGRSGSGKTTLLNLSAGLTRPTSGQVLVGGMDLWDVPDRQRSFYRNQKIGFIFQFPSLLPSLTTLENVAVPTTFGPKLKNGDAFARARDLLRLVGLGDKLDSYPRQLSAGQQQRAVIARSLVNQPAILMADEPTSNLDEQTEKEIMDLLRAIHASRELTVLLVTHTPELRSYGTRWIRMADGSVAESGLPTVSADTRLSS
jgi:ABC-type lipoprotein export system ATPase subunit